MHSKSYITVRYAETDRMGIAHHSNYPIWYEVGRTDFVKLFGTTYSEMEAAGVYDDTVRISVGIEDRDDLISDFTGAINGHSENS